MIAEFVEFSKQRRHFSRKQAPQETAKLWWNNQPQSCILKSVAMRIVSFKSSSANIERVLSCAIKTQGYLRTRFDSETLFNLIKVNIALNQGVSFDLPYCDESDSNESARKIVHRSDSLSYRFENIAPTDGTCLAADDISQTNDRIHTLDRNELRDVLGGTDQLLNYEYFLKCVDFSIQNGGLEDDPSLPPGQTDRAKILRDLDRTWNSLRSYLEIQSIKHK